MENISNKIHTTSLREKMRVNINNNMIGAACNDIIGIWWDFEDILHVSIEENIRQNIVNGKYK